MLCFECVYASEIGMNQNKKLTHDKKIDASCILALYVGVKQDGTYRNKSKKIGDGAYCTQALYLLAPEGK